MASCVGYVKDMDKTFVKAKMSEINPVSLNNQFVIMLGT